MTRWHRNGRRSQQATGAVLIADAAAPASSCGQVVRVEGEFPRTDSVDITRRALTSRGTRVASSPVDGEARHTGAVADHFGSRLAAVQCVADRRASTLFRPTTPRRPTPAEWLPHGDWFGTIELEAFPSRSVGYLGNRRRSLRNIAREPGSTIAPHAGQGNVRPAPGGTNSSNAFGSNRSCNAATAMVRPPLDVSKTSRRVPHCWHVSRVVSWCSDM